MTASNLSYQEAGAGLDAGADADAALFGWLGLSAMTSGQSANEIWLRGDASR
jgi:hypothetical protein